MVGCPVRCDYCPQDALLANYPKFAKRMLSLEDFAIILPKIPKHVRIDFSGMAEPWANPECTNMLRLTLAMDYSVAIYTTLQGMTPEDADDVAMLLHAHAAQIEVVCLHLPDEGGHMRQFKKTGEYLLALDRFMMVREAGFIRRFELMTMDHAGGVASGLGHGIKHLPMWEGHDRAGSLNREGVHGTPSLEPAVRHKGPVSCSYTPFYDQNVLMPNGDVYLCCMDYGLRAPIGNLLSMTYEEVRYFAQAASASNGLTAANMDSSICRKCNRATEYHQEPGNRQMWVGDK